jgi:SAM-dependent methyltransferase
MKQASAQPFAQALASYHDVRFQHDARRSIVWRVLASYLQRWIDDRGALLELGAGYGEFVREIRASQKWALDVNPALPNYWGPEVTPLIQSALDPLPLESASLSTVFASNFFEHLTLEQGAALLTEVRRVLRPGGRLVVVQPNFRLEPRRYFDDYTHRTIYTDNGFCDLLRAAGWRIEHCEPRFTPFSMKSRLPVSEWLLRLYLALPWRPLAGQFLVVAERPVEA